MNAPVKITMPPEAARQPKAYQLLIDGKAVDAADGRTIERRSPGHGFAVSLYPRSSAADVGAAVAVAHRAFETGPWPKFGAGERSRVPAQGGRPDRAESGGDRAARCPGIRQTNFPGARRSRRGGRHLALRRSPCPHASRRILRQSRRRHAGHRTARTDRRRRHHHAVEFPVPDRLPETALRARGRLHRGGQAERDDVGLDLLARRTLARSRRSGRRRQHRHRAMAPRSARRWSRIRWWT